MSYKYTVVYRFIEAWDRKTNRSYVDGFCGEIRQYADRIRIHRCDPVYAHKNPEICDMLSVYQIAERSLIGYVKSKEQDDKQ